MFRSPSLHTLFTCLLALLLSILLYRDRTTTSTTATRFQSSSVGGIDLTGQLSDTSDDLPTQYQDMAHLNGTSNRGRPGRPKVLLVNDDGPPSKHSPHVLGLYEAFLAIGWDVTVVLPSFQKSWGSMQFSLQGPIGYWYYYPLKDNFDGSHPATQESWSATRRPINKERGEIAEWILVDGSPTTACNAGLFNQNTFFGESEQVRSAQASPATPFDLVVSGPNFGRNTGTAFALSSGTLGAALAASLAGVRSVAVSFGHFMVNPPTLADRSKAKGPGLQPDQLKHIASIANKLAVDLVEKLWKNWDQEADVGTYSINVPLSETITQPEVLWTRIWENRYGPLFAAASASEQPPSLPPQPSTAPKPEGTLHFAPNMASLLRPKDLPQGTDVWALQNGYVSISRLRPNFMEVDKDGNGLVVPRRDMNSKHTQAEPTDPSTASTPSIKLEDGLEVGKRWRL